MVLIIVLVVVALLAVWIVRTAGWRFAATRFAQALLIVVLVTFGTSWLLTQLEGDPCITVLGTGASEENVAECRADRKLDESVFVQYGDWAGTVLSGDLGYAQYRTQIPLSKVIGDRALRTVQLFLYSQFTALLIAVPLGIWAAYQAGRTRRGLPKPLLWLIVAAGLAYIVFGGVSSILTGLLILALPIWIFNAIDAGPSADNTVNTSAFMLLSLPVFVLGETLRYEFAVKRGWYDLNGYKNFGDGIGAHFASIWLPALVLGLALSPVYLRLLRADMTQNLQQDFVAVAKAKGLPNWKILFRHVLRPSTLTLLTVAGLNIAQLVNGAIVIEFIYDLDGMGSYLIEAVAAREFFPVQTLVAIIAVLFVLANTIIDVLYTAVDPRVKADADR